MAQYAIYLRKSRADLDAESRGEGETLAKHRTALRALAKQRKLNVVKEYAELVTGDSIAARPQMQALLEEVKRGMYDGVIVNDVDRLGRGDSIDQEIIKYTFIAGHCIIITPTRDIDPASPSDEDMLDFSLFFARFEYRKISQRLFQGRLRSAEAGNYINPRIPFGYKQVRNGRQLTLEPDEETAPIVRMIFDTYANRVTGYNAITRKLNDMGIKTTRGYKFYPNTIRHMLENPVYIGTIVYGKTKTVVTFDDGKKVKRSVATGGAIKTEHAHPAIVPEETFYKVQAILEDNKRIPRANINKPLSNPLAGLVHCSICGLTMQANTSRRGRQLACSTQDCPTVGTPLYVVEREIIEILKGWCTDFAELPSEPEPVNENIDALQRQLKTIEIRLNKARELVELGVYTPAEYSEQKNMLTRQADAIKREMAESSAPSVSKAIHEMLPEIEKVIDAYQYAETAAEKNNLLKTVIQRVDYSKSQRAIGKQSPTLTLKLVVYPKLYYSI